MLPKVTLNAPPHIDGATIHASQSGKAYTVDEQGLVVVDSVDVKDLLGTGFTIEPTAEVSDETKQTTTSVSPTSASQGATALDPAARAASRRDAGDTLQPAVPNQADHGGADPGHGEPVADTSDPKVGADAKREAEVKAASGGDASKASAVAETGGPNQQASTKGQQAAVGQDASAPKPAEKPTPAPSADKPKG